MCQRNSNAITAMFTDYIQNLQLPIVPVQEDLVGYLLTFLASKILIKIKVIFLIIMKE